MCKMLHVVAQIFLTNFVPSKDVALKLILHFQLNPFPMLTTATSQNFESYEAVDMETNTIQTEIFLKITITDCLAYQSHFAIFYSYFFPLDLCDAIDVCIMLTLFDMGGGA